MWDIKYIAMEKQMVKYMVIKTEDFASENELSCEREWLRGAFWSTGGSVTQVDGVDLECVHE